MGVEVDDDQDQFDVPIADDSLETFDFEVEIAALGWVAGDPIRRDESGNDSGNFSSVLEEPISLQYGGQRSRRCWDWAWAEVRGEKPWRGSVRPRCRSKGRGSGGGWRWRSGAPSSRRPIPYSLVDTTFPLDILPSSMSRRLLLSLLVSYRSEMLIN
ncbi:hypothetical protein M0R45_036526 [Rubus argutus]|uniref:Uncharacterized protein n=1 Tax=Rubus argutus TaxID=59490 RepID=A0AAW1VXU4_RUBAR